MPDPVKVLVVTTFNLDEYVYEALRAGASGFLLKDAPAAQLLDGIRTVASGSALLAPEVTRKLVGRYASRIRPTENARGGGVVLGVEEHAGALPALGRRSVVVVHGLHR